jgi:hypothetical protein
LAAAGFALGWFSYLGMLSTVRTTHIAWLMREDWASYFWGFAFFRNAAWSWPLGNTPNLYWPQGTSIGFTDSNPWLALLMKACSALLPLDFQYCGLWFLLCYVLQALFGTSLTAAFTKDKLQRALGGCMFALTPVLPARHPHVALSALFMITAILALHLRALRGARRRALSTLGWGIGLLVWASGTHAYLSSMVLVLWLALCLRLWRIDKLLSASDAALATLAALVLTLITYWSFGYIGWKPTELTARGFGQFSSDLTAFINPQGWSRWVSTRPFQPRQWEGFAYLGTGVICLLGVRIALWLRHPRSLRMGLYRHGFLLAALLGMWCYALSSSIAFDGRELLNLDAFYQHIAWVTGVYRSSGRFVWPLHLSLIALALSIVARLPRWFGTAALCLALLLQVAEFDRSRLDFRDTGSAPLNDPAWQSIGQDYRHLELVPLHLLWTCRYDTGLVNRLSYAAYVHRLTFNSGNFGRRGPDSASLCERHLAQSAALSDDTIFVVDRAYLRDFQRPDASCGSLDGLRVCVSARRPTAFLDALRKRRL